jgi:hypothetical protein
MEIQWISVALSILDKKDALEKPCGATVWIVFIIAQNNRNV